VATIKARGAQSPCNFDTWRPNFVNDNEMMAKRRLTTLFPPLSALRRAATRLEQRRYRTHAGCKKYDLASAT